MTKDSKQYESALRLRNRNRDTLHRRSLGLIGVFVITLVSGFAGLTVLGAIFIFFLESEEPNSVTSQVRRRTITEHSAVFSEPSSNSEPGTGQSGGSGFFGYGIESMFPHTDYVPNEGAALKAEVQDRPSSPGIGQVTQVRSKALERYSQGLPSISGRALSSSGVPLPQLQLSARRAHLGSQRSTEIEREAYTQSMAGGHYQFAGLEEGEYIIALADGSYPSAKVLARTGSLDADLVVPELNRSLTLYGTIQNRRGEPVSGSLVMLAGGNSLVARSDANGKYKIKFDIYRDRTSHELRIQHDAYEPVFLEITDQHLSRVGDQLQVDITLQALQAVTAINGQVRNAAGAPLPGETVWFHSPKLEQYYSAITDATGRFVISRVESSTDYRLQVRPREPYRDYTRENLRVSGEVTTHDIVLETGTTGTINGKIVAPDWSPIPGFNLWLRSVDRVSQTVELRTDNIGNFIVNDAPAGDLLFYSRSAPQIQISGVYLPPDKSQNVNLVVDWGNYECQGRVLDFANNPIPGATLLLTWFQQQNGIRSRSIRKATTDRDGLFRFTQLALGQRTLRAEAPGYRPVQIEHKVSTAPGVIELRLYQQ